VELDRDLVVLDLPAENSHPKAWATRMTISALEALTAMWQARRDEALPEDAYLEPALELRIVGVEAKVRCHAEFIVTRRHPFSPGSASGAPCRSVPVGPAWGLARPLA